MSFPIPSDVASAAAPLFGTELLDVLLTHVERARSRVWASVFIIDVRLHEDPLMRVRTLLQALARAHWRGVDVRVLTSPSRTQDIVTANLTSLAYLREVGVPGALYRSSARRSTHSKFAVVDDDLVLVGSHNWTDRGFAEHLELSLAVRSEGLAAGLSSSFEELWAGAGGGSSAS